LREIRFEADAVITGGETVRREGWFFPPNGSLIVLTQLGDLPLDTCPHQDRLLICSDFSDMPAALARLGAQRVLCEGGPRLVKKLLVNDLIDELFISVVSNSLEKEGENAAAVARSAFGLTEEDFELREAVNDDGISFTRFLRRRVTDRSLSSVGKVDL
jgi:riboflavin biosynthesis pyrimidine reductase